MAGERRCMPVADKATGPLACRHHIVDKLRIPEPLRGIHVLVRMDYCGLMAEHELKIMHSHSHSGIWQWHDRRTFRSGNIPIGKIFYSDW